MAAHIGSAESTYRADNDHSSSALTKRPTILAHRGPESVTEGRIGVFASTMQTLRDAALVAGSVHHIGVSAESAALMELISGCVIKPFMRALAMVTAETP
jgi:hypothetical protein